ncbi:MAG: hypothetical protein DWH78_04920 [Planctomycetota bacterium]|nr:MAG: hypothetical protein DWH78_04920 [Planctomycetota bacterium]
MEFSLYRFLHSSFKILTDQLQTFGSILDSVLPQLSDYCNSTDKSNSTLSLIFAGVNSAAQCRP